MALLKSKTLENGATGKYWKITAECYDRMTRKVTWQIALFTDQAHATLHGKHLGLTKSFSSQVTPEEASGNRTALGYAKILEQASQMVNRDITGALLDTPVPRDSDLADAEST